MMGENLKVGWPSITAIEIAELYHEISKKKKLDLEWSSPGKIDPQIFDKVSSMNNNSNLMDTAERQKNDNSLADFTVTNK